MEMNVKDSPSTDQDRAITRLKKKTTVMKTTRTLFKTLDEVVFETRNKMYGAYMLRKNYGRRTLLSTAIAICLVSGFLFALTLTNKAIEKKAPEVQITQLATVRLDEIKIQPKKEPKKQSLVQKAQGGGVENRTVNIVDNNTKKTNVFSRFGGIGLGGDDDDFFGFPEDPNFEVDTTTVKKKKNNNFKTFAQFMPEFPGGVSELYAFLQDNIYYPERMKNLGIEGTVYVSFVIEEDGSISRVSVERGIENGDELNKIALKAIQKMPNWIPGRSGNTSVAVKQTIPIQFSLVND
jgi:protein TonB